MLKKKRDDFVLSQELCFNNRTVLLLEVVQPPNSLCITGSLSTWTSTPNLSSSRSNLMKYEKSYKKIDKKQDILT